VNKRSFRYDRFAREYLIDMNGTRAALAAGYKESSASAQASMLLKNRKVQALLNKYRSERAQRLEVKADKVLEEISRLAFANMQDYTRVQDGKPVLDLSGISRDQFAAVQEIREDTTGGSGDGERKQVIRTTLKLADKARNLELLGRHLKMFTDQVEVTGKVTLEKVLESKRRAS
jgi:phage terminase small subunit